MKNPKVSKAMAERVLFEVRRRFADQLMGDAPWDPALYEPGYHADGWVIAWDGGPEDWTSEAAEHLRSIPQLTKYDIWVEAINHWSIAILRG